MTKANPCMDPSLAAGRLTLARLAAGFKTGAAAARAARVKEQTYRTHENGTRGFNLGDAVTYAAAFKTDADYIMHGKTALPRSADLVFPREVLLATLIEGVKVARLSKQPPEFVAGMILEALEDYPIDVDVKDPSVSARISLARHKKQDASQ